jgi:integrase
MRSISKHEIRSRTKTNKSVMMNILNLCNLSTVKDNPSALPDDFAEIVANKIQQAGKKKLTVIGLQEAFEIYLPTEFPDRNPEKDGYVRKIKSDLQLFVDIVQVEKCCDLVNEDIVAFSDIVRSLPKKYDGNSECKGLSYREMVNLPNQEKPSQKTVKNKCNNVIAFLEWCDSRNYIDIEYEKPFKKLKKIRGGKGKGGKNKRVSYSPDELKKLFNSKEYLLGCHKTANHHWVPLIGLFTGARLGEICQLRKEHIVKDSQSDIWYFDFNDYSDGESIKTDAGIRFVPVHPQLRKLGFFKYYDTVEDGGLLFPKWRKGQADCKDQMRWFSRTYREKCGVKKPKGIMKDFHSLRNTIINTMKQSGIPVASAREIVGHEDEDMSYGGYADVLDLPSRKKVIDEIKYPSIDWDLVKERGWRQTPFSD